MKKTIITLTVVVILFNLEAHAARVKDIADIRGVRENPLIGMGLVLGLRGTGDKAISTLKVLCNLMKHFQMKEDIEELKAGNIALVTVTASLPPLAKKGTKIDITVSSMGDARSLAGGVLIATPLKALDGNIYAVAQGRVDEELGQSSTTAYIFNGAIVEREYPVTLVSKQWEILLILKRPDFNTADRIAAAINKNYKDSAQAVDLSTIKIQVPETHRKEGKLVSFIAEILELRVSPDTVAIVVINAKTGTIVVGKNVTISPVAIAHRHINITLVEGKENEEITVEVFAKLLNALGVSTSDLIAIFNTLKRAGALHAELVIM